MVPNSRTPAVLTTRIDPPPNELGPLDVGRSKSLGVLVEVALLLGGIKQALQGAVGGCPWALGLRVRSLLHTHACISRGVMSDAIEPSLQTIRGVEVLALWVRPTNLPTP